MVNFTLRRSVGCCWLALPHLPPVDRCVPVIIYIHKQSALTSHAVRCRAGRSFQIVPTLGAIAGPFAASTGSKRQIVYVSKLQPSDV